MAGRRGARGFTYVGLLFAVVLLGILLSAAGTMWSTEARREKEKELLFAGEQYRQAIASYRAVIVNGARQYPPTLDELIEDHRFPMPVRHLRKRYRDPITNGAEWGLLLAGTGIAGVYSLSAAEPLKKSRFGPCCLEFEGAGRYSEWKFIATDGASPPAPLH